MFEGTLKKMLTENASPIRYFLDLGSDYIDVNACLDRHVSITQVGTE